MNDGPAGLRAVDLVSGFPPGITAVAAWNKVLIRQHGRAIAEEFRTKGTHIYLGPAMDAWLQIGTYRLPFSPLQVLSQYLPLNV